MSIKFLCLVVLLCATQREMASPMQAPTVESLIGHKSTNTDIPMSTQEGDEYRVGVKDITCAGVEIGGHVVFVRTDGCMNGSELLKEYQK